MNADKVHGSVHGEVFEGKSLLGLMVDSQSLTFYITVTNCGSISTCDKITTAKEKRDVNSGTSDASFSKAGTNKTLLSRVVIRTDSMKAVQSLTIGSLCGSVTNSVGNRVRGTISDTVHRTSEEGTEEAVLQTVVHGCIVTNTSFYSDYDT